MTTEQKIEDKIYSILFDHSRLSDGDIGVRVCFEDEWPLEALKSLIKEAVLEEREKTIKMLWSIHEDEVDKEMEAWNRSLDLAIFRLKNPGVHEKAIRQQLRERVR